MEITAKNLQKKIPLSPTKIIKTVKKVLEYQGIREANLSFVFTTDQRIKSLNKQYLKRNYATDVLAFDLSGNNFTLKTSKKPVLSGEIIISTDTVIKNASLYNTSSFKELDLCIVHGILHLLGYNDHAPKDIKRMRQKEKEILSSL